MIPAKGEGRIAQVAQWQIRLCVWSLVNMCHTWAP